MPYFILNGDNSIRDVVLDDPGLSNSVQVGDSEMDVIKKSPFGHVCYRYESNALVMDQTIHDGLALEKEKNRYIKTLKDNEINLMADERLATVIVNVKKAKDKTELDLLRGN